MQAADKNTPARFFDDFPRRQPSRLTSSTTTQSTRSPPLGYLRTLATVPPSHVAGLCPLASRFVPVFRDCLAGPPVQRHNAAGGLRGRQSPPREVRRQHSHGENEESTPENHVAAPNAQPKR